MEVPALGNVSICHMCRRIAMLLHGELAGLMITINGEGKYIFL
jgi:hypothetical protein